MSKLGSKSKPAVISVQTEEKAEQLMEFCHANGWEVIIGIEPDEPEDTKDIKTLQKLDRKPAPLFSVQSKNAKCNCGSGKQYKRCCAISSSNKNIGTSIVKQKLEKQGYTVNMNEGKAYSAMLLDLINPYQDLTDGNESLDYLLELGTIAWNLAILKTASGIQKKEFPAVFDASMEDNEIDEPSSEIVKEIIKEKEKKYLKYLNFIQDYELFEDENNRVHITVISKPFGDLVSQYLKENG